MGTINIGNQKVRHHWTAEVNSDDLMNLTRVVIPNGIYSGLELSIESSTSARCSAGIVKIADVNGEAEASVEFQSFFVLTLSESKPFFCLYWEYKQSAVDIYVEPIALSLDEIQPYHIVVGKAVFVSGSISYFNYTRRSVAPYYKWLKSAEYFKVLPTNPYSLSVNITGGEFFETEWHTLSSQTLALSSYVPSSNKNIVQIGVNSSGFYVIQGLSNSSPINNYYGGKLIIAEIILYSGQTQIKEEDIKRIPFYYSHNHRNLFIDSLKTNKQLSLRKGLASLIPAYKQTSGNNTGALTIKTSIKPSKVYGDFSLTFVISENVSASYIIDNKTAIEYQVFGSYNSSGVFSKLTCYRKGIKKYRLRVGLSSDGYLTIFVGEIDTSWTDCGLVVKDFHFINLKGYTEEQNYTLEEAQYFYDWSNNVSFLTSLTGYSNISNIRDDNAEIGTIKDCAVRYNIHNALLCDGSTISKTTNPLYTELIDILKAEAGADTSHPYYHADSDKAVLPNLLGKFTRGIDTIGTIDKDGIRKSGNYQADDNKSHNHTNTCSNESSQHNHPISLTSGAGTSHSHTYSGTTSTNGSHDHGVYGSGYFKGNTAASFGVLGTTFTTVFGYTTSNGNHSHTFSGTTSSESSHTHSVSGNTGTNSVNHNHTITINNTGDTEVTVKNVAVWKMIIY